MGWRIGPGPVFVYEGLTAARRWQLYAVRAGFVGAILLALCLAWRQLSHNRPAGDRVSLDELAYYGRSIYSSIAMIELAMVLLVAPAATAGAVCLDKARGTLDHMLVTDLSNAEIVLGKLGVRLIPVLGLIACVLPVVALASLLGGIDPIALLGSFLTAIGCAFVGCSLAMVLSVYGRKTHEVLMMTYLIVVLWALLPVWLEIASFLVVGRPRGLFSPAVENEILLCCPLHLMSLPYRRPAQASPMIYLGFLAGCLGVSAAFVALATARVRRVALRQAGRPAGGPLLRSGLRHLFSRWNLPGPSMDPNPVAWREWHRARPSLMMRVVWGVYTALGLLWVYLAARPSNAPAGIHNDMIAFMCGFQVAVGLLLLSVGAATSLAEERVRGGLDVLLSTPISTRSILAGKWWGSFRRVLHVAVWPLVMVIVPAYEHGSWAAYLALLGLLLSCCAAITSLGLAAATWVDRPGRAVALCVAVYVLVVIGWPVAVLLLLPRGSDSLIFTLMMGNPPFGVAMMCVATAAPTLRWDGGMSFAELIGGALLWMAIYAGAAVFLNWITHSTFDDRLGRIPDSGLPRPRLSGLSSLSPDELLAMVSTSPEGEP
jgi:ABC-type transport system involved in multi-copper enzyme maturation permease subunit